MTIAAGTVLKEQIVLERELGRGGMGSVWVAKHRGLDIDVAVKFLDAPGPMNDAARERFHREARAMAKIDSVHVVRVSDVGTAPDGRPFIVMELLRGEDLKERIEGKGALPLAEVSIILEQICEALERAHALGIVHRDMKPANVFLLEGPKPFVKLLDFGIVKLDLAQSMALTATAAMIGTPYYMSPEQFIDARSVDHRTDLWSVAVIAYACLTGALPFMKDSVGALAVAVHEGAFEAPSTLNKAIPPSLDEWFRRALSPDREQRFQSARELASAFRAAAGGTVMPLEQTANATFAKTSPGVTRGRVRGRGRVVAGAVLAAVLAAGGGIGGWLWWTSRTKPKVTKPRPTATAAVASAPPEQTTQAQPKPSVKLPDWVDSACSKNLCRPFVVKDPARPEVASFLEQAFALAQSVDRAATVISINHLNIVNGALDVRGTPLVMFAVAENDDMYLSLHEGSILWARVGLSPGRKGAPFPPPCSFDRAWSLATSAGLSGPAVGHYLRLFADTDPRWTFSANSGHYDVDAGCSKATRR